MSRVAGADPAAVAAALAALGPIGAPDAPLGALTTYRVGGPAAVAATATTEADLATVRTAVEASGLPVLVVGRGSNLLVADRGFAGLAVLLDGDAFAAFAVVDAPGGPIVRAGSGLPLPALARRSVEAGLTGLEWAVGVPGSVGGGVRMNAGGHGSDLAAAFRSCRVVDVAPGGTVAHLDAAAWAPGYRSSAIGPTDVVVSADLVAGVGDPATGRATIREIVRWRRDHQPGGQNAGSVFANPAAPPGVAPTPVTSPPAIAPTEDAVALDAVAPDAVCRDDVGSGGSGDPAGRSAGWLVEAAGWKGRGIGSARVSPKHANFIQAEPGGSADDVLAVLTSVRSAVADRFGVELRTEIRCIGFSQPQLEGEGASR